MNNITYVDLHVHTEYSLKDGKIRIADIKDPKHIPGELIKCAQERGMGVVTATDHGNMYGQGLLASCANRFKLKHIPACEFYLAKEHRSIRNAKSRGDAYWHICAWAKNKNGYRNLCILQKLSYTEGFYYAPRIDRELIDKYGDDIMWSDACMSGFLSGKILSNQEAQAYEDLQWFMNRFKDDFYVEVQNHGIPSEDSANEIKIKWANQHGIPIIATTDSHYARKDEQMAHKMLLSLQYNKKFNDPTFTSFQGDGYWLLSEDELVSRFPKEYLNNTKLIADKVDDHIIEFGKITPPKFQVPKQFTEEVMSHGRTSS